MNETGEVKEKNSGDSLTIIARIIAGNTNLLQVLDTVIGFLFFQRNFCFTHNFVTLFLGTCSNW